MALHQEASPTGGGGPGTPGLCCFQGMGTGTSGASSAPRADPRGLPASVTAWAVSDNKRLCVYPVSLSNANQYNQLPTPRQEIIWAAD